MKKIEVELFCPQCLENTVHRATCVGDFLLTLECSNCGKKTRVSRRVPVKELTQDFLERLMTKPLRITEELRRSPRKTLLSLPRRAITKPLRLMQEVMDDLGLLGRERKS